MRLSWIILILLFAALVFLFSNFSLEPSLALAQTPQDQTGNLFVNPNGLAVDSEKNVIYVGNSGKKSIVRINGKTNSVVDSIQIDGKPSYLALDTKRQILFAVELAAKKLNIINLSTNEVKKIDIPTPSFIRFISKTGQAVITSKKDGLITLIDSQTYEVKTISYDSPYVPWDDENGNLYVTNQSRDVLAIFDPREGKLLKEIPVGKRPLWVYGLPDGSKIYVGNNERQMAVIDGLSRTLKSKIDLPYQPGRIFIDPLTNNLLITYIDNDNRLPIPLSSVGGYVGILDTATDELKDIRQDALLSYFGRGYNHFVYNHNTHLAYFASTKLNRVAVVDGKTAELIKLIDSVTPTEKAFQLFKKRSFFGISAGAVLLTILAAVAYFIIMRRKIATTGSS